MANTANFFGGSNGALGPVVLVVDPEISTGTGGSAINLGDTQSTIIRDTVEKADLVSDQDGSQAFNKVVTGEMVELESNLVKTTHEIIAQVLQGYLSYSSGANGSSRVSAIGEADLDIAQELSATLFQDGAASTDRSEILFFGRAAPMTESEWTFDVASQRVMAVKFRIYKSPNFLDNTTSKETFYFTADAFDNGDVVFST